jgi:uncharacterized membrane protein YeaQ/YmgE (transglycosylase-associated protein family)
MIHIGTSRCNDPDAGENFRMNMLLPLVIQLIAGAIGGNAAGAALKEKSLGPLGNTIAGIVGGGLGGLVLVKLMGGAMATGGGLDVAALIEQIIGGGLGGAIVTALVGVIKNMNKS